LSIWLSQAVQVVEVVLVAVAVQEATEQAAKL
jgi:hypothetical protein